MDGQEYLNQISAKNRPVQKTKNGIFSSKFFIVGAVGLGALILIIIIGMILGGNKSDEKNIGASLLLHVKNTTEEIEEYQPYVKSSNLRSASASLHSILSNTTNDLEKYMETKYDFKEKNTDKKILAESDSAKEELDKELFEAKINGVLDRTFAHKMAFEITDIQAEESKMIKASKSEELKSGLQKSYDSLKNLYSSFSDFSEGQ